jgi:hypothetical protein
MAKNTIAQEVSTGTPESFTDHEMNDPEPHLAILRNRPTLGGQPLAPEEDFSASPADTEPIPEQEPEEIEEEVEEFEETLEPEPEEIDTTPEAPPAQPAKKTAAKKATASRKRTPEPAAQDDEDQF